MRKLVLAISHDDEVLQDGGILATKRHIIGTVSVIVTSGFNESHSGLYEATSLPDIRVLGGTNFDRWPDYKTPFDMKAFDDALILARVELREMMNYITAETNRLFEQYANKTALDRA